MLGDLLVQDKLITLDQLENALKTQKAERMRIEKFDLGEYLVSNRIVDRNILNAIEKKYRFNVKLGDSLVADRVITQEQLDKALTKKKEFQFVGEVLLQQKLIDKSQLYEALKQQFSVPSFQAVLVNEGLVTEARMREIMLKNTLHPSLGEVLIEQGAISILNLHRELRKHKKRRQLGDMLVESGFISVEQLELALEKQRFSGTPLGKTLINSGVITEVEFSLVLARQFAMPFSILDDNTIPDQEVGRLTNIVGIKEAIKYHVIPLSFKDKKLKLAVFNPYDIERVVGFDSVINFDISLTLTREEDFRKTFERLYGRAPDWNEMNDQMGDLIGEALNISIEDDSPTEIESKYAAPGKDKEAENLVNLIVSYGITSSASDIHIEHDQKGVHVRYRVDGVLRELKDPDISRRLQAKAAATVSRVKVMSSLDIAERRLPQDGAFRLSIFDTNINAKVNLDFRVAICRSAFGENVVMRIIDSRKADMRLDELTHSKEILDGLVKLLKSPAGMLLVVGPTGSGKSSTLYASLHYLNNTGTKIITAEDPVEHKVAGIMQTQVLPKIGLTFVRLLKSFLRQDPDIIMVGEVRDAETVRVAVEAALTGHFILSSLHTNDSIGSISRMRDMGLSDLQIVSALRGVLAQRLVRAICKRCRQIYMPSREEWSVIFPEEPVHLKFYQGAGCQECNHTGFAGRVVISELFLINQVIAKTILQGADEEIIYETAKGEGMKMMIEDGLDKLDQTTLSELIKVIPTESVLRFRTNYTQAHSMFHQYEAPEGCALEFQTLFTAVKQGMSKIRIHELFVQFRNLRKRMKEPTDHLNEHDFGRFLESKLKEAGSGEDPSGYRISLLNHERRAVIMVEASRADL